MPTGLFHRYSRRQADGRNSRNKDSCADRFTKSVVRSNSAGGRVMLCFSCTENQLFKNIIWLLEEQRVFVSRF